MPRSTINGTAIDLDGKEMILDADQDTTITSDTDDQIDFKTGGTDRVTIDSSGRLLLGTSTSFADANSEDFQISGSGDTGMMIKSGTSNYGSIYFGDATSGSARNAGIVRYYHTDNAMQFFTNETQSMVIDSIGAVTKPLQPAFCVQKSSQQANFSINGFVDVVFDSERFDQNADFASNTFTAPVTGKYQLGVSLLLQNVDTAANYYQVGIVTSNQTYLWTYDPGGLSTDILYIQGDMNLTADMDASDTAKVVVYQNGGAAQSDISYGGDSVFSGCLLA